MKKIGRFQLGIREVDLYCRAGTGGSFYNRGKIVVGIDDAHWVETVSSLLHEALEMACSDMRLRYRPTPDFSGDHANYFFVLTHEQFSEAAARAGEFMANTLPSLADEYNKNKKIKKKS